MIMTALVMGATSWLVAEYVLHRFVGHGSGHSEFALEHRRHHSQGNYFAPTAKKALHVTPVILAAGALGGALLGAAGVAYAVGLAAMYVAYECLHRRLHTHPPRGPVGRFLRRHHFFHHFHDPRANHGVTTPLLDLLWGTRTAPGRIRVPQRLAPPWLLDSGSGDMHVDFQADYELLKLKSKAPAVIHGQRPWRPEQVGPGATRVTLALQAQQEGPR